MNIFPRKKPLIGVGPASVLLAVFFAGHCHGQDIIPVATIRFDGPPILLSGAARIEGLYTEAGLYFTQHSGFVRRNSGREGWPDDGSTYLVSMNSLVPVVTRSTDGSLFDLLSLDLAEYSDVVPDPVAVHFVGYRPDGSTVTFDRTTDGIMDGTGPLADFETFDFQGYTGLNRLEMFGSGFSLDNLVVSIPEPTSVALLSMSVLLTCLVRATMKRRGP